MRWYHWYNCILFKACTRSRSPCTAEQARHVNCLLPLVASDGHCTHPVVVSAILGQLVWAWQFKTLAAILAKILKGSFKTFLLTFFFFFYPLNSYFFLHFSSFKRLDKPFIILIYPHLHYLLSKKQIFARLNTPFLAFTMSTTTESLPPILNNISLPQLPEQPPLESNLYNFEYLNSEFFLSARAEEDREEDEQCFMSILNHSTNTTPTALQSQPKPQTQGQQIETCTHRPTPSTTIPDLVSSSYQSIRMFTHSSTDGINDDDYDEYDSSMSDSDDPLPEDYDGVFGDEELVEHAAFDLDRLMIEDRGGLFKMKFLDPLPTGRRRPLSSIYF